ncbi:MAG: hypothetical protein A3G59_02420 [Candidatus Taylorbacteria bacterium RIFCSPLOWO2_12_FULL_47_20]|uniref:ZIP family metal transporter n=2 Tax=Candidatus Tayloriibacteriota TaxID=1817919 RepID=A0A1G2P888_9BACT|nr:MAG: hypothetical protein A3H68_00270 [Candidatus Taylorbacteria bacterium RIFCSPLOWO2_02_FULL_46_40]OHA44547.1 MAG: hypothetical protein A3G59_02420 [Candidatus Taylorbacteria bacterium RIFCSPLOWO2_12_FULL_47_20]
MQSAFWYSMASVLVVSAISLMGIITLSLSDRLLRKLIFVMVSIAAGALLGDAFLHLIPQAVSGESGRMIPLLVVAGIYTFFILEKVLCWRHKHGEHEESLETISSHDHHEKPMGVIVLVADGIHNLLDGVIIGISFLAGTEVGIATTVAVILHEIPQEFGDFGVLLHSGWNKWKAIMFNFLTALLAVVGTILVFIIGRSVEILIPPVLAFAAGGFIYIAASDLLPSLGNQEKFKTIFVELLFLIIGTGLMALLALVE